MNLTLFKNISNPAMYGSILMQQPSKCHQCCVKYTYMVLGGRTPLDFVNALKLSGLITEINEFLFLFKQQMHRGISLLHYICAKKKGKAANSQLDPSQILYVGERTFPHLDVSKLPFKICVDVCLTLLAGGPFQSLKWQSLCPQMLFHQC